MTETKGEYAKITWRDVTVKIGTLKPWEGNPKTSTKKDARALLKSWDELGQFQTIAIGPDGDVYDGHQRLSALMVVYGSEYQVAARVSSRPLTDEERRKIAIYSRQIGAWDWDILSSWQPAELMEWGFDGDLLKDWKRDTAALSQFLASENTLSEDDAFGALPDEDRAPFQQMTFTLHDTQAEQVREALKAAKAAGDFVDSENENSNGNALARICETYLGL